MKPSENSTTKTAKSKKPRLHIILDNIRSAYNVGSIFRTADATGCAKIYCCGISAYPPNPKLVKTALGATQYVPWEYFDQTTDAVKTLQEKSIPVFAVELTQNSKNYKEMKYPKEFALVFGHEINGVGQPVLDTADETIHIPMRGQKKSLNVATVAGVVMFEGVG